MFRPRQIRLTLTKYGFLYVYNLTAHLASLKKVSLYNKIPLFIVSTNCSGKQFTNKFLLTSSNQRKFEECSVLKGYWLSCNNSCAESCSHFEHVQNWFLKMKPDTNLCQVLVDINYTRDWQLGLNENLQYSVVKPLIFTTQKMKFSVKDLFNKCE